MFHLFVGWLFIPLKEPKQRAGRYFKDKKFGPYMVRIRNEGQTRQARIRKQMWRSLGLSLLN